MGMNPAGMSSGNHILFIEMELSSGNRDSFIGLKLMLETNSGMTTEPVALIENGTINTLASLTFTGEATAYQPDPEHITWAFFAAKNASQLYPVFPNGDKIDLSPLLN